MNGPNPYASPASQPQASIMQQYPESGVDVMPTFTRAPQQPNATNSRAIANGPSYRTAPGGNMGPPVSGGIAQQSGARSALAAYMGNGSAPSTNALTALMQQRFGNGGTGGGSPALEKPMLRSPAGRDPRSALATYLTGGGAAVRGGVNANGMGVRPPSIMRPVGGMYR